MSTEVDPSSHAAGIPAKIPTRKISRKEQEKTDDYLISRFKGEGVRYKAKLIGIDDVQDSQGDKMCMDSMMKLKGIEVAARSQGQHKQRIYLKISAAGIKIIDERTGGAHYIHATEKITYIMKCSSDPRTFAYVFENDGKYQLFAIKTANSADHVVEDLNDIRQLSLNPKLDKYEEQLLLEGQAKSNQEGSGEVDLFNPTPVNNDISTKEDITELDLFSLAPPVTNVSTKTASASIDLGAELFSPAIPPASEPASNPANQLQQLSSGMLQQAAWGQQMSPNFGQMNSAQGVQSPQFGQPAMPWGQQMPFGLTSPTQPPQWGPTGQPPLWGQQSMTWRQPGSGAQSVGWEQLPTPQSGMITPPGHASQGAWGQATPFGNPLPMYSTAMAMGPVVSPLASPVQASIPNPWQTGVPSSQPAAHSTTSSFPAMSASSTPNDDPYAALRRVP